MFRALTSISLLLALSFSMLAVPAASEISRAKIYNPGELKAVDSQPKLKVGDRAPEFTLPSVAGDPVSLSSYAGKKNVVISFVPAAWTPVCSDQWPGYNIVRDMFDEHEATL
ncbi:MAG: redoxin domain-containing protein, partial [Syntrophobacteraceae bacterium]